MNRIVAAEALRARDLGAQERRRRRFHPIHIHLSLFQIMKRNGAPPRTRACVKDTVVLGPNDEVELKIAFEDFKGGTSSTATTSNTSEDMAMMARFDTV
jgi:FtsP/CotA-like multicopper oxidase with cupredoxin domain